MNSRSFLTLSLCATLFIFVGVGLYVMYATSLIAVASNSDSLVWTQNAGRGIVVPACNASVPPSSGGSGGDSSGGKSGGSTFNCQLANSGRVTLNRGATGQNTITIDRTSGTTRRVTLSVSGLPSGASGSFGDVSGCSPDCTDVLRITTSRSTPTGTFRITVTGLPLGRTTSFNLVINAPPSSPELDLRVNNQSAITVKPNQTFYLTWSSDRVSNCWAWGGDNNWWNKDNDNSGSAAISSAYGTHSAYQSTGEAHEILVVGVTTYRASCNALSSFNTPFHTLTSWLGVPQVFAQMGGVNDADTGTVVDEVVPPPGGSPSPPPTSSELPIASLTASPPLISPGQFSTLQWTCTSATSGSINNGVGVVCNSLASCSAGGTKAVSPAQTTKYTLTCTNTVGSDTDDVTVLVGIIEETRP